MIHVLNLGAGVQSSTMALMAARGEITPMPDCAIFADTGWEPKKVYEYLDWLKTQLPFEVHVVSAGNIREDVLNPKEGKGQANPPFYTRGPDGSKGIARRSCTTDYKVQPIRLKVRELLGIKKGQRAPKDVLVTQWIGISKDEIQRMKESTDPYARHRWPLLEKRMTRIDCLRWMESNGYPLPHKSSCLGCPYHSNAQWREVKADPEAWNDVVEFDRLIRSGRIRGLDHDAYLHRDGIPLDQVDLSTAEERGQQVFSFMDECEGMCGV